MAHSEEISARLGLDTNSFKQGLEEAKGAFNKAAKDMEKTGGHHGEGAGKAFVHGLEHHLLGTRKLSGAFLATVGLEDFKEIGEKIAGFLVGGTKEQFKELEKIEEHIAQTIERLGMVGISSSEKEKKLRQDILEIEKQRMAIKDKGGEVPLWQKIGLGASGLGFALPFLSKHAKDQEAFENQKKDRELLDKRLEKQVELKEGGFQGKESLEQVESQRKDFEAEKLSGESRVAAILARQLEIRASMEGVELSAQDRSKKEAEILKLDRDLSEARAKIVEKNARASEEEIKRQQKIREEREDEVSGVERLKMLQEDVATASAALAAAGKDSVFYQDLLNAKLEAQLRLVKEVREQEKEKLTKSMESERKTSDEDKLSLQELASHDSFEVGISSDVRDQSSQAREILNLRAQAEEARKMGGSDQSAELRAKADTMTQGLSTLKDSEKTPSAAFKEALKDTNTKLDSIDTILKGKFVAQ